MCLESVVKKRQGFFLDFILPDSPSGKPVINPKGVKCALLTPGTVIHLHALIFA